MPSLAQKQKPTLPATSTRTRKSNWPQSEAQTAHSDSTTPTLGGYEFSQVPAHAAARPHVQAKMKVNAPGDIYEQEADRVADEILRAPDPAKSNAAGFRRGDAIARVQRRCNTCETEDEETLRREPFDGETSGRTPAVTPQIQAQIASLRGGGQPLTKSDRDFFEPRFAHDFSRVRVHTGAQAGRLASRLQAQAFTVGPDIVFGAASPELNSHTGRRLMAHELTHVVQQSGADAKQAAESASPQAGIQRKPVAGETPQEDSDELKKAKRRIGILRRWLNKVAKKDLKPTGLRSRWARWVILLDEAGELNLDTDYLPVVKSRLHTLSAAAGDEPVRDEASDDEVADDKPADQPATPISFSSQGVEMEVEPALTIEKTPIGGPQSPAIEQRINIGFPELGPGAKLNGHFQAKGKVSVEGGTDAEASGWQAGFTQTMVSASAAAKYRIDSKKCFDLSMKSLANFYDANETATPPWIHPRAMGTFDGTNTALPLEMNDHPEVKWGWSNRNVTILDEDNNFRWESGALQTSCGVYRLATWLLAWHPATRKAHYLNYAVWDVDFGATFDAAAKTGQPTGVVQIVKKGEGKGSLEPRIDGPLANKALKGSPYTSKETKNCGPCVAET